MGVNKFTALTVSLLAGDCVPINRRGCTDSSHIVSKHMFTTQYTAGIQQ